MKRPFHFVSDSLSTDRDWPEYLSEGLSGVSISTGILISDVALNLLSVEITIFECSQSAEGAGRKQ